MRRTRLNTLVALVFSVVLAMALLPGTASAVHFGQVELDLDIRAAGADAGAEELVTNDVDFVVTARNISGEATVPDTSIALDLPDGFSFVEATDDADEAVSCTVRDGRPEVLCDIGDLTDTSSLTITTNASDRTASTVTGVAYAIWDDFPAVFAIDTVVLANVTLQLEDTTAEAATDSIEFAVLNTADPGGGLTAANVTVELRLPEGATDAEASVSNQPQASCATVEAAGGNIVCQGLEIPSFGPLADPNNPLIPRIEVTGLSEEDRSVLAEAKGDNSTRAAIGYNADGTVNEDQAEFTESATRGPGSEGGTRSGIVNLGVKLGEQIDLPATELTPVGGQVSFTLNDAANTGEIRAEWTEDGTHYSFVATEFRNIADELDYFQDGGINFDTHQHGTTFRPNGPGNIPDLWVQALVYSVGTLTVRQPGAEAETFEGVAMHAMYRQLAGERDGEEFQRWSEKGEVPARTDTADYGEPVPPLPANMTLMEVLFANTPAAEGEECTPNGIAGEDCNADLGTFVRFLTFANTVTQDGFSGAGVDLLAANPYEGAVERFESIDRLGTALNPDGDEIHTAIQVGLEASAKTFADAGVATGDDPLARAEADYVVLSRDDVFADSLAGSGLASTNAPILFTASDQLSPEVLAEINRVLGGEGDVYVLGGEVALSAAVAAALEDAGYTVRRLSGPTRYETAAAIAEEVRTLNPDASEQLLVRGSFDEELGDRTQEWADSIAGGPYAASEQIPVFLTPTDALHPAAAEGLDEEATTIVIGGTAAVNEAVAEEADPDHVRVSGENRVATSVAVAEELFERTEASDGDEFVISPGEDTLGWAYGLAAAPHSALAEAPLLLLRDAGLPQEVIDYLSGLGYAEDTVGSVTVSSSLPTDYTVVQVLRLLSGGSA